MQDGDEAIVYFRGRHEGENALTDYFDVEGEGEDQVVDLSTLEDMGEDELWEVATHLNCNGLTEDSGEKDLREAITRRIEAELEPITQVKHYIPRNKGQKRELWINCANPDAAANALDWRFETDCRPCYERMNGDEGVSTMSPFTWTVWDTRSVHRVPTKVKGEKDKYESCTMLTKNRCRWCSHNKGIDPREQDDIKLDELKKLALKGYCRKYQNKLRLLELPETQYGLIEALEAEVRTTCCRACGEQTLQVTGATCPDCDEEFDFDALLATGWDPEKPSALAVRCESCDSSVKPDCAYECECGDPTPARLGDVPVKARMTKEGKNQRRVWTFKIAGKAEPFVIGESDERDVIIKAKLFDFDEVTKAPTIPEQVHALGAAVDPITGDAVEAPPSPVQSAATRTKPSGTTTTKAKGGKPGGLKSGNSKTSNRTLGSRFTKRA